ncbi:MAG: leucine-rich repeat protein [Abditibacteriota bacterium]|nr:leucine-rich repeat protein [Abditibacteriota bacterium]
MTLYTSSFRLSPEQPGRMRTVRIPEGQEFITFDDLAPDATVRKLILPKSLVTCEIISRLPALESISVHKDNPYFSSSGGVLYNRDFTRLVKYPPARKAGRYEADPRTETIGKKAFCGARALKEVILGKAVRAIEPRAFHHTRCRVRVKEGNPFFTERADGLYSPEGDLRLARPGVSVFRPEGLQVIDGEVLDSEVRPLTEVYLPESLREVRGFPFVSCYRLRTVHVPGGFPAKYLPNIYTPALRELCIPEDAPYALREGGVYSRDGKTLYLQLGVYGCDVKVAEGAEEIADHAFVAGDYARITLPPSLKRMGRNLFVNFHAPACRQEELVLQSLPEMDETALLDTEVRLVSSIPEVKQLAEEHYKEYADKSELQYRFRIREETVTGGKGNLLDLTGLPGSVKEIAPEAFAGCFTLEKAVIPEGVRTIGARAFAHCPNLKEAWIPASVSNVGVNPFEGCTELKEIRVSPRNPYYTEVDGCLYDKDVTLLIACPPGLDRRVLRIPGTVTRIGHLAMINSMRVEEVFLPPSVIDIGKSAFAAGEQLKAIHIDNTYYSTDNHILSALGGHGQKVILGLPAGLAEDAPGLEDGTVLAAGSFARTRIRELRVPDSVVFIDAGAFTECAVEKVSLPGNCVIMPDAFAGCRLLRDVSFRGAPVLNPMAFNCCPSLSRKSRLKIRVMADFSRLRVSLGLQKLRKKQ